MVDRGTKRRCSSCGASYYDLNRTPIKCPKCDAPFVATLPSRGAPPRGRAVVPPPVEVEVEVEEEEQEAAPQGGDEFEETDDLPSDDENFGAGGDEDDDRD